MKEHKPIARLVVRGIPDMGNIGRRRVACWLREQASHIEAGDNYSKKYTARYWTVDAPVPKARPDTIILDDYDA